MEIPEGLQHRIESWENLSRWERSEVGRDLRRLGMSYGEIRALIEVKKSTLANWCRDVELTDEQQSAILKRTGSRVGIPRDTNWRRRLEIEAIREAALQEAEDLVGDPFWVAGVVLYWAEGAKTRNHLQLANTDPQALRMFIDWVRRYIDDRAGFVLQMHLHEGNDEKAARDYWIDQTGLIGCEFHKTFIKPKGTGHRKNHLPHGVCRVSVRRAADPWNRIMAWIEYVTSHLRPR